MERGVGKEHCGETETCRPIKFERFLMREGLDLTETNMIK